MKTEVVELAATSSKPLDVVSPEPSSSDEDYGSSKTSGMGALGIRMSVAYHADMVSGKTGDVDKQFQIIFLKNRLRQLNKNNNYRN